MKTVRETAEYLVAEHLREGNDLRLAFWAEAEDEVRLIEVTDALTEDPDGEVLPFSFVAFPPEVPYPSTVILLSPPDWDKVERGELVVPAEFNRLVQLYP